MTSLYNVGKKWVVRDKDKQWEFDSFEEAQKRAAECTASAFDIAEGVSLRGRIPRADYIRRFGHLSL